MVIVSFRNAIGMERVIAQCEEKDVLKEISDFCTVRNFEIYYVRSWLDADGRTKYDVGSHVEFFYTMEVE